MAQFNKKIVMTITQEDVNQLTFSKNILLNILVGMKEEDAEYLENIETGGELDLEDIKKAIWIIETLIDSQEGWGWGLV